MHLCANLFSNSTAHPQYALRKFYDSRLIWILGVHIDLDPYSHVGSLTIMDPYAAVLTYESYMYMM